MQRHFATKKAAVRISGDSRAETEFWNQTLRASFVFEKKTIWLTDIFFLLFFFAYFQNSKLLKVLGAVASVLGRVSLAAGCFGLFRPCLVGVCAELVACGSKADD